jgi:putative aldouronate transport system permease protein
MTSIRFSKMGEHVFQALNYLFFSIVLLVCLYPFYYIFLVSLSDPALTGKYTITVLPVGFTLKNYEQVFALKGLYLAFLVSVGRTAGGTLITLFFTSILAYTLTKRELIARRVFYRITITAMYLNAGIIPWYLTMRALHLKDSFFLYILPTAVSVYSMILIKTYIEQIPAALEESAIVDGAGYFTIFRKIVLPICMPILAAVTVFAAVTQWNSWMDNLLLVNNHKLDTLQYVLLQFLRQADAIAAEARNSGGAVNATGYTLSPFSVRMTVTMVATIPVLLVYPFVQKFFVSGIMLGAVKG